MKLEHEELLLARGLGWRPTLAAVAIAIAAILLLYRETAISMLALWASYETYAHGYVIVPISLWLVWMRRHTLASITPRPSALGVALLFVCALAWLAAEAGQVQVVQQYALTAMVPAAVLAIAGRQVAWAAAFPLGFLLLAVPFGEAFLPALMDWTANFTVGALRVTGIPVYREGNLFAVPSGTWSVVEACSGLRYLIASITVGALFTYLTYRKWWKRALFFGLSIGVPIIANFMRAYIIVMVGHFSSMKLAVGVDHFIYGWVFFGVVIALLFWIGSSWRDQPAASQERHAFPAAPPARPGLIVCSAAAVVAVAAALPVYADYLDRNDATSVALTPPREAFGWSPEPPVLLWTPLYASAEASTLTAYRKDGRTVVFYLAYYRNQRKGVELVSAQNAIDGGKGSLWARLGESTRTEELNGAKVDLRQTQLRGPNGQRLLVWDWYRIAGQDLSNPYLAKALLARDKLLGRSDDSTAIAVAAPYRERPEAAAETLRLFLKDMLSAIDAAVASAHGGRG